MITFLAVALAAHAAAADAPAAPPTDAPPAATAPAAAPISIKTPDEQDRAAEERIKGVEDCVDTLDYFRQDLKAKKDALNKEFKNDIPSSFSNLLNLKANRISKQQLACSKLVSGADQPLDAALLNARTMDGASAAYAARKKKLDALRERLNKALKRFMTN
jgi:hypothetical protein